MTTEPNQRQHDSGREARHSWMEAKHVAGVALALASLLGGSSLMQGRDSAQKIAEAAIEAKSREEVRDKKREAANEKLETILRGMAELKGHADSSDKASERVVAELARVSQELRELDKTAERVSTRLDEHERRISALEGKAK